jgi:hypothetical protein
MLSSLAHRGTAFNSAAVSRYVVLRLFFLSTCPGRVVASPTEVNRILLIFGHFLLAENSFATYCESGNTN